MAAIVGLLITAILVVNNLRDIETDRKSGKRTLAVMIGKENTRWEYALLLAAAYVALAILWAAGFVSAWLLFPLATLPLAMKQIGLIWKATDGATLNNLLAGTARLAFIFSVLLAAGLVISSI